MSTRQDLEREVLTAQGYSGALPDQELKWLRVHGGPALPAPQSLSDAWLVFLAFQLGAPVLNRADGELAFLRLAVPGEAPTLADGWLAFWSAGAPLLK